MSSGVKTDVESIARELLQRPVMQKFLSGFKGIILAAVKRMIKEKESEIFLYFDIYFREPSYPDPVRRCPHHKVICLPVC